MDDFRRSPNKQLEDPEYQIMRAMIAARTAAWMTHHELSKRTGINQSNLSRIENGNPSPHFSASHPHRERSSRFHSIDATALEPKGIQAQSQDDPLTLFRQTP